LLASDFNLMRKEGWGVDFIWMVEGARKKVRERNSVIVDDSGRNEDTNLLLLLYYYYYFIIIIFPDLLFKIYAPNDQI